MQPMKCVTALEKKVKVTQDALSTAVCVRRHIDWKAMLMSWETLLQNQDNRYIKYKEQSEFVLRNLTYMQDKKKEAL